MISTSCHAASIFFQFAARWCNVRAGIALYSLLIGQSKRDDVPEVQRGHPIGLRPCLDLPLQPLIALTFPSKGSPKSLIHILKNLMNMKTAVSC
jgi:hypothetical protein